MSRVRLTHRKTAADMGIPYPGNVNQPDRKDPAWEDYHTFEQTVNHELPDMRHDWKSDERDDIGFGISEPWGESPTVPGALPPPTVASVRVAANKAVRIAVLLLGEKVDDEVIEAQARDLMSLSQTAMDRTLSRFAETQKLYAEEDEDDEKACAAAEDKKEEEKKAEDKDEDAKDKTAKRVWDKEKKKFVDASDESEKKEEEKKAEDKKEDEVKDKKAELEDKFKTDIQKPGAEAEVKASSKKAELPPELKENAEKMKEHAEKKEEDKKASKELAEGMDAEKKSEEVKDEEKKAEDKEEEKKAAKKSSTDMDIELNAAEDEEEEECDPAVAAQLASLFEDSNVAAAEELPEKKEELSKKAGIKKLGGQPKVASAMGDGSTDISSIWDSAPDVSEVFK